MIKAMAHLNSNLILLIRVKKQCVIFSVFNLNSNLILLILNLLHRHLETENHLNSNLILLILKGIAAAAIEGVKFKFQSDSINTIMALQYRDRVVQI